MKEDFFGLCMDVPDSWRNYSTILFVAPTKQEEALPTLHRQTPLAEMSVAITISSNQGKSASEELSDRLSAMQHQISGFSVVNLEEEAVEDGRDMAIAVCNARAGFPVDQVVAVLLLATKCVSFVGTTTKGNLNHAMEQLRSMLTSIRLGN